MSDVYKVLITGSRDWKKKGLMRRVFACLPKNTVIIHGGAKGADTIADDLAKSWGFPTRVYPANWKRYGKAAGPIRNQEMLDKEHPDLVIAFPLPESKGTINMINKAKKAGIEIRIVEA